MQFGGGVFGSTGSNITVSGGSSVASNNAKVRGQRACGGSARWAGLHAGGVELARVYRTLPCAQPSHRTPTRPGHGRGEVCRGSGTYVAGRGVGGHGEPFGRGKSLDLLCCRSCSVASMQCAVDVLFHACWGTWVDSAAPVSQRCKSCLVCHTRDKVEEHGEGQGKARHVAGQHG